MNAGSASPAVAAGLPGHTGQARPATPSHRPRTAFRRLALAAASLAFCVVAFGAYVRLSDAGLGCPDWPGCYGRLLGVPSTAADHLAAAADFPGRPVDAGRAWKEMTHRYLAGSLGLAIAALCILAWRRRAARLLPSLLVGIVAVQALLGMWTVTLLLRPLIVSAHLIGGMTTLALLVWLALRAETKTAPRAATAGAGRLRHAATLALVAVALQIALGGWVSSNYAGLACGDFPACQGTWLPPMDFARAFTLQRELGHSGDGSLLPLAALTAIHWTHRVGALIVAVVVASLAAGLLRTRRWRPWGWTLAGLLALQVGLGIANVLLALPLPLAVAHNAGAAALLAACVALRLRLRSP